MNFVAVSSDRQRSAVSRHTTEPPEALLRWGSSSVAYLAHKGHLKTFGSVRTGCIYYADFQNCRFVLGDPVASRETTPELLRTFCERSNNVVFAQISEVVSRQLDRMGLLTSRFGLETTLHLPYDLSGKGRSDIRLLYNRGTAAGVQVAEYSGDDLHRLHEFFLDGHISAQPRYRHGLNFLARSDHDPNDPLIRWFVGTVDGKPVGVSIFYPIFLNGRIIEYAEILPIRFNDAPKGTRVKILLEASRQFEHEGVSRVNLGLSPFKINHDIESRPNLTERFLNLIFRFGAGTHNFRGLAFHKSRYRAEEAVVYWATTSKFPILPLARLYRLSTGSWLPAALLMMIS